MDPREDAMADRVHGKRFGARGGTEKSAALRSQSRPGATAPRRSSKRNDADDRGLAARRAGSTDALCINAIRTWSMDAVQQANSGHPGTPMGLAPVAYTLWQQFLRFDPADPIWPNRDRFVLSEGHASALLWSLLFLTGVRAVDPEHEILGEPAVSL